MSLPIWRKGRKSLKNSFEIYEMKLTNSFESGISIETVTKSSSWEECYRGKPNSS